MLVDLNGDLIFIEQLDQLPRKIEDLSAFTVSTASQNQGHTLSIGTLNLKNSPFLVQAGFTGTMNKKGKRVEINLDIRVGKPIGLYPPQDLTMRGTLEEWHATKNDYLEVDIPLQSGNSGGPIMTLDGKVVAITDLLQADFNGENMRYLAEKGEDAKQLLNIVSVDPNYPGAKKIIEEFVGLGIELIIPKYTEKLDWASLSNQLRELQKELAIITKKDLKGIIKITITAGDKFFAEEIQLRYNAALHVQLGISSSLSLKAQLIKINQDYLMFLALKQLKFR